MTTEPTYFKNAAALRRWFARHASTSREVVVGFAKAATGFAGLSPTEAVDEANRLPRLGEA